MINVIARREAKALFRTPLAWVLLCAAQLVLAYQFLAQIEIYLEFSDKIRALPEPPGVTEIIVLPTFGVAAMMMAFLLPVLTMSSLCGERRNGTLHLLYSSPVTPLQIVLGKFTGILLLVTVMWVIAGAMPLTLLWGAPLDLGLYAAGLFSLALLMVSYAAIGLMFSALFAQPGAAAIAGFGTLLTLWLVDWAAGVGQDAGLFSYLSSLNHYQNIARGLIGAADIIYFLNLTLIALAVTTWRLDSERRPL